MANQDIQFSWGLTHAASPVATVDNQYGALRVHRSGELITMPLHGMRTPPLVDEGVYWTGMNVPQTALLDTAALTAFVATTPTMVVFNNNPTGGKSLYPTRFRCSVSAAGTSGTNWLWQWLIDTGNRWTSGGTALTLANTNINASNTTSGAVIHFGAVTAPAANASRIVGAGVGRTVIKVIGDEYTFEFGNSGPVSGAGMPTDGTLQLTKTWHVPAVVIPPQCSLVWYEYAASQGTAAQFDNIAFEYVERQA
jgi:hypothetical protein